MAWGGLEGELEGRQASGRRAGRSEQGVSVSRGVELKGRGVVTCGAVPVLLMMLRA